MKKARNLNEYEPTVADVLDVVKTGFARNDRMLGALHDGQETFRDQLKDFDRRLTNTQNRVEDIADNMESVINLEQRIRRLEKTR